MTQLSHVDLFSGIGGFALAASWAGFETRAFCEIDPFCQKVLRKNFGDVPCFGDIRDVTSAALAAECTGRADLLTGGFPCQDISSAGNRAGLDGERSGLWAEMFRIIREARPVWVVAENVSHLRTRGADRVLSDLESAGYTCWPLVVGADKAGAPHERERVWVVAHASQQSDVQAGPPTRALGSERNTRHHAGGSSGRGFPRPHWDVPQPRMAGVFDGLPNRMERVKSLGNAIVPQVAYEILRPIAEDLARAAGGHLA